MALPRDAKLTTVICVGVNNRSVVYLTKKPHVPLNRTDIQVFGLCISLHHQSSDKV
jgi:hypothetical protein